MALRHLVLLALGVAFVAGCGKPSAEGAPAPSAAPSSSAAPAASTGVCPSGTSSDPPQGELRPAVEAFRAKKYKEAQSTLDQLSKRYPTSATVRVWRGDASLFDRDLKEVAAADAALPFYVEADALHAKGCKLPDYEHYYLRMDYAYAELRKRDPDAALTQLEIAKRTWDNSAEVDYHMARAYCLKRDVDRCVSSFEHALEIAKSLRRPKFLRTHHSLEDWIRRSHTQSEFGPLRKDPRYPKIIAKLKSEG